MKSPEPSKTAKTELTFQEAIGVILTGQSVTKLEWDDRAYHALLVNEQLMLHKPDGKLYQWLLSEGDLRGEDYVIL